MEQKPSMLRGADETTNSLFIGRRSRKKIFVAALGAGAAFILVAFLGWIGLTFKDYLGYKAELDALKAEMKAVADAEAMEDRFIQSMVDRGLWKLPDSQSPGLAVTPNSSGVPQGVDLEKAHKDFHDKYYPEDKGGGEKKQDDKLN